MGRYMIGCRFSIVGLFKISAKKNTLAMLLLQLALVSAHYANNKLGKIIKHKNISFRDSQVTKMRRTLISTKCIATLNNPY